MKRTTLNPLHHGTADIDTGVGSVDCEGRPYIRHTLIAIIGCLSLMVPLSPAAAQSGYVANLFNNTVSVLDTSTNSAVGSPITVGLNPAVVALTPDGKHAYVAIANLGSANHGSVSVIDTSTNTVAATVLDVGTEPIGIAISPDGTRAWVACSGQSPSGSTGSIAVIDTSKNTLINTIAGGVGNPIFIVFSLDGTRAYVTDFGLDAVLVFDTATDNLIQAVASPSSSPVQGIALTPDGTHLYVTNTSANSVFSIDTSTYAVSAPIAVGKGPLSVAFSLDGSKAYVVNDVPDLSSNGSVSVIDTATNTVSATIPVGLAPAIAAISADGSKVFVTNIAGPSISVISTSTNTVTATITDAVLIRSPYGIAIPKASQPTPAQMVMNLIATVQAMNLTKVGKSLTNMLQVVETDITTQNGLACQDLEGFANHVKAAKSITPAQEHQLLAAVASIESALNCGP